jgi:catechol 2,3-dioxygenase-like lactoylglutathione lyase family enzyme
VRLNHVTLSVSDLKRSQAFYLALGLHLIVDSLHYNRFVCPDGDSTFSIHIADQVVPGTTVIYFECDNLDTTVADLLAAGIVFDQPPTDQRWLWREAYLRDPDGHRICLFCAGENRLNPPWRV